MAGLAQADPIPFLWDWTAWVAQTGVKEGTAITAPRPGVAEQPDAPAVVPTTMPAPTPPPSPASASPGAPRDAYLDFGTSSYPEQNALTVGAAQPWYDSASVTKAFGHVPTAQEQQGFINAVVSDVQHTFTASGLTGSNAVSLTTDPSAGALHTLSVVSGLSYAPNPQAIGITDVGGNGFSFVDKLSYATDPTDLEWAVAHNIAHELMHAFGVAVHHDQTGDYLDAATAKWSLLIDPNAQLSPAAVSDIVAHSVGRNASSSAMLGGQGIDGDQELLAPVPEPATVLLWSLAGGGLVLHGKRTARHRDRRRAA
jgi:hypothetical protein